MSLVCISLVANDVEYWSSFQGLTCQLYIPTVGVSVPVLCFLCILWGWVVCTGLFSLKHLFILLFRISHWADVLSVGVQCIAFVSWSLLLASSPKETLPSLYFPLHFEEFYRFLSYIFLHYQFEFIFYIKYQTFSGVLYFCSVICWKSSFILLILLHFTPNQRVILCWSLWGPLKNSIRQFVHIIFFPESVLLCSTVCPQILHPPVSAFMFLGLCACIMEHDDAKMFVCLSSLCHIMCDETENSDLPYFMGLFQNSWDLWIPVQWMLGIFCLCISSIWLAFL